MIQPDTYHMMEASGVLFVICAYNDDKLIGFINLIVSVLPHYGKKIAATESFFVTSGERTSGAGMMLLKEAEVVAKDIGAVALMVSARTGSQLATLLDAKKQYRETNRIYTKCFR
jgi:GNAT superfamily N-acetyltransferase